MNSTMKNLILLILIVMVCYYMYDKNLLNIRDNINLSIQSFEGIIKDYKQEVVVPANNKYKSANIYSFVKDTTDFIPNNKQEIYDIYYTALNAGWDEFTFYCPTEYTTCVDDIDAIGLDNVALSHFNSFIHPYNSFESIKTKHSDLGKVTIIIDKQYREEQIIAIDTGMNELYSKLYNSKKSIRDNIKIFHDYIINATEYDNLKNIDINDTTYQSNNAYGPLFEGYAVCSGYTDLMALFLNKLGVVNMKVATENHVWNLVYLDGKWYHLDLTWDDPVTNTGKDMLIYSYFLVDYKKLKALGDDQHNFNETIYKEAL